VATNLPTGGDARMAPACTWNGVARRASAGLLWHITNHEDCEL
jgi:hypothetical protein